MTLTSLSATVAMRWPLYVLYMSSQKGGDARCIPPSCSWPSSVRVLIFDNARSNTASTFKDGGKRARNSLLRHHHGAPHECVASARAPFILTPTASARERVLAAERKARAKGSLSCLLSSSYPLSLVRPGCRAHVAAASKAPSSRTLMVVMVTGLSPKAMASFWPFTSSALSLLPPPRHPSPPPVGQGRWASEAPKACALAVLAALLPRRRIGAHSLLAHPALSQRQAKREKRSEGDRSSATPPSLRQAYVSERPRLERVSRLALATQSEESPFLLHVFLLLRLQPSPFLSLSFPGGEPASQAASMGEGRRRRHGDALSLPPSFLGASITCCFSFLSLTGAAFLGHIRRRQPALILFLRPEQQQLWLHLLWAHGRKGPGRTGYDDDFSVVLRLLPYSP